MIYDKPSATQEARAKSSSAVFPVPGHLRPTWRQLPALAGVVTDRLAKDVIHRPVVGVPVRLAANLFNLAVIAGAHLSGRLVAYNGEAVMWFVPLHPPPARLITRIRDYLPRMSWLIPLMPAYLAVIAAIIAAPHVPAILTYLGVVFALWYLVGIYAMTRRGNTTKSVHAMERAFSGTGLRLVLAGGLARARHESAGRAVTAMLLGIRREADSQQITIVANAATSELATLYQRNGFRPLPTGERHLVRTPNRATRHPPRR